MTDPTPRKGHQATPRDSLSPPPNKPVMWRVTVAAQSSRDMGTRYVIVSAKTAHKAKEIATRLLHRSIQELKAKEAK